MPGIESWFACGNIVDGIYPGDASTTLQSAMAECHVCGPLPSPCIRMALDDAAPSTAGSRLRLLKQPKPVTHNTVVKQLRIRFRIEYGLPREVSAGLEMS